MGAWQVLFCPAPGRKSLCALRERSAAVVAR